MRRLKCPEKDTFPRWHFPATSDPPNVPFRWFQSNVAFARNFCHSPRRSLDCFARSSPLRILPPSDPRRSKGMSQRKPVGGSSYLNGKDLIGVYTLVNRFHKSTGWLFVKPLGTTNGDRSHGSPREDFRLRTPKLAGAPRRIISSDSNARKSYLVEIRHGSCTSRILVMSWPEYDSFE